LLNSFFGLESIPLLWLQIGIVAVWISFILAIAWMVNRFANPDPELTRKIVHIGTGNVILFAWWLDMPAYLGIAASILASAVTLLSFLLPILPGINTVGRRSLGTFFYAISIGVLVAWFWYLQQPQYAALGILIMAWGDGFAALIGQRIGKHKYQVFGGDKSWEGSFTMLLVSYIVCSLIFLSIEGNIWQTWAVSAIVAVVATALEAFSFLGIDNITVPIGSAALAFVLMEIIGN
jgi:phytol kinase